MFLSVYTLYRSEDEEFLESWIKNVQELGAEGVICSSHNIPIPVCDFKLRVIPQPSERYSKKWYQKDVRNKALDICTGDWILQLDIDENVDIALKYELEKRNEIYPDIDYYALRTINFWNSYNQIRVDNSFLPDWHWRLFRNRNGIQYIGTQRHCCPSCIPDIRSIRAMNFRHPIFMNAYELSLFHKKYLKPRCYNGIYRCCRKDSNTIEEYNKGVQCFRTEDVKGICRDDRIGLCHSSC